MLFDTETADIFRSELVKGLNFPFVSCKISTLGGKNNISIILTISNQKREEWINGILENSPYLNIGIDSKGNMEAFGGYQLKLRKTKAKDLKSVINKINSIKG